MKRTAAKGNKWQDAYSRQAKKEKFPARSVYKLKEIQQKYNLINKGDLVLDLGCYPGSWLLYAAKLAGNTGKVIGIDLKPIAIDVPQNVTIYERDVFSIDDRWLDDLGLNFNVVLSDMASATTGNKTVDAARSLNLCQAALSIAKKTLLANGFFVCKIFQSQDVKAFMGQVKAAFRVCKMLKPRSSRKASKEIFVVGLGFKRL